MWVGSLGREDPLEKGMATHSSILPWKISWTEELGRLQYVGSQRVGCDLAPLDPPRAGSLLVAGRKRADEKVGNPRNLCGNRPLRARLQRRRAPGGQTAQAGSDHQTGKITVLTHFPSFRQIKRNPFR